MLYYSSLYSIINIQFNNAIRELKVSSLLKQSNICKSTRSRNGDNGKKRTAFEIFQFLLIHSKGVSYDLTVSSTALVFTRFILLKWMHRKHNDEKTIAGLFFVCCEDIQDMELSAALIGADDGDAAVSTAVYCQ